MEADFVIKKGDLSPAIVAILRDADQEAIDLQTTTIRFHMRHFGSGAMKTDAAAESLQVGDGSDGSKGKVRYQWAAADTDTEGWFEAEFEVTNQARPQTFPNSRHLLIEVLEEIA